MRLCRACVRVLQHATSDVEKMVLGNKCDMNDRRQVSKDRGAAVSTGGWSWVGLLAAL